MPVEGTPFTPRHYGSRQGMVDLLGSYNESVDGDVNADQNAATLANQEESALTSADTKYKPRTNPRTTATKTDWKPAFLKMFRDCGVIRVACEYAMVDRSTVGDRKKSDPVFAAAYDEAIKDGTDVLESEARRRAIE